MYTIYKHIRTIVLLGATIYVIWTAHFESLLHICMSLYVFVGYVSIKLHELYHIISPWYFFSTGLESSSSHQALEHSWPTWPFQESSGQRTASARELSAAWIPSDSCSLLLEQMTIWLVVWNMVFIFHNIWIYIYIDGIIHQPLTFIFFRWLEG